MTLLYCGDPHGHFGHILAAAAALQPSAVIVLGDLELARPLHVELAPILERVWFIHGNHDTDINACCERIWNGPLAGRNLHGRVVTLQDGTRIAGLGGVFRKSVWHPEASPVHPSGSVFRSRAEHARITPRRDRWQGGPPMQHWSSIYPDELDRLADLRADILVMHEAPGYHPHGVSILDTLAQSMGAKLVVHGHHHDALDSSARWQSQGFRSFGVGLRGITAIDVEGKAKVVLPGERDHERHYRLC